MSSLENQLIVVINDFINLAKEKVENSTYNKLYLAQKIKSLVKYLKTFSNKNELKEDLTSNDIIVKLTNSVIKYKITVLRYIIESLLNQELTNLPSRY